MKTKKTDITIALAAWRAERLNNLACFEVYWKRRQGSDGLEDWPEEMSAGDWDEQYAAFRGEES